jgi:hypothetical protein
LYYGTLPKGRCDIPAQDELESTSGPCVRGMACVGNCPTLLVERGSPICKSKCQMHSNSRINPFTQNEDKNVSGVDASACFTQYASRTEPSMNWGVKEEHPNSHRHMQMQPPTPTHLHR